MARRHRNVGVGVVTLWSLWPTLAAHAHPVSSGDGTPFTHRLADASLPFLLALAGAVYLGLAGLKRATDRRNAGAVPSGHERTTHVRSRARWTD